MVLFQSMTDAAGSSKVAEGKDEGNDEGVAADEDKPEEVTEAGGAEEPPDTGGGDAEDTHTKEQEGGKQENRGLQSGELFWAGLPPHSTDSAKNSPVEGGQEARQGGGGRRQGLEQEARSSEQDVRVTRKPLPVHEPKPVLPVSKQIKVTSSSSGGGKMVSGGGGAGGRGSCRTEVIEEENSSEGQERQEQGTGRGEARPHSTGTVTAKRKMTPISPRVGSLGCPLVSPHCLSSQVPKYLVIAL